MADSNTRLGFTVEGNVSQGNKAITDLKNHLNSELGSIGKAGESAFKDLRSHLNSMVGELPIVGNAIQGLAGNLADVAGESAAAGTSIAALAGPAAFALVGIGALVTGIIELHKGLFELAQSTAEWQGKLFDMSQQTGVSVELLSALGTAASTTGGSLEGVVASLGIFQKNMEAAQDSTSKQAKAFASLGVETLNTEDALKQTLSQLSKLPEGYHQTALALELFGRGGKSLLAILKETHGDLDTAMAKFRELGIVVSTEDAKAADDFNDQIVLLNAQMRGMAAVIGQEVMPLVISVVQQLSQTLKENKETVQQLGQAVGILAAFLGANLVGGIRAAGAALIVLEGHLKPLIQLLEVIKGITGATGTIAPVAVGVASPEVGADVGAGAGIFRAKAAGGGGGGRGRAPKAEVDEGARLLHQLETSLENLTPKTELEAVNLKLLGAEFANINPKIAAQIRLTAESIDVKKALAIEDKKAADQLKNFGAALTSFMQNQAEQLRQIAHGSKTATDELNDFITAQALLGNTLSEHEKEWLSFNAMLITVSENADKMHKAIEDAVKSASVPEFKDLAAGVGTGLGAQIEAEIGPPPEEIFNAWKAAFSDLKNIGADAFHSLASGIGNMVENYVLLGTTGPAALKKLLAATLAQIAAESAVKAIYWTAQGIVDLFFNPARAATDFAGAALFASIAGVSALAGRAIAGDSFKSASTGGGSSSGSKAGGSAATNKPSVTDVNRNVAQPQEIRLTLTNGLHEVIEAHVVKNWNDNGRIRTVVQSDGQG